MKVKEESEKPGLKLNIQKLKIMSSGTITSWQIDGGNNGKSNRLFSWTPKSLWIVTVAVKLKNTCSLDEKLTNLDSLLKSTDIADKGLYSQSYGFASSQVQMWELDYEEGLNAQELMFSNCGAGEDSWKFLGLQKDQINQS